MVAVAVGWQVYNINRDPLDLGLIGLAEFLPLPLLALPAGQLADRFSRRFVFAASLLGNTLVTALLLVVSAAGATTLWPFLALAATSGAATAIGTPAARALPPTLVPVELVSSAMAFRSIAFQVAIVGGPALGGILFAISPELDYAVAIGMFLVGFACMLAVAEPQTEALTEPERNGGAGFRLLAGIRFMRATPTVLGAITLDLFAVLFGGAAALLPLFARDILHTGPVGLGVLRSAPAVGALAAGIMLARRPLRGKAGLTLLIVVAIFGASTVVFGLSRSLPLSLAALAVAGFADMISMNIRSTTVALATPDALRGRVVAVEMVFISASNELGAFESGVAAAILGATTAVVAGGIATIALAAVWLRLFPSLAKIDRMEDLTPDVAAVKATS
jgi:predicted MFS family arabinose efflux permease